MFRCWYYSLTVECVISCTPDVTGPMSSKTFNLRLISPLKTIPKVMRSSRCFWQERDKAFVVFAQLCFEPCSSPMAAIFAPVSVLMWNHIHYFDFTEESEACCSLDVYLGSSLTSWISCHCAFARGTKFSPFVNN